MTCEGITSTLIGKLACQHVANRPANFLRESPFEDATEYLEHLANDANEEDMLVFFDLLSTNDTGGSISRTMILKMCDGEVTVRSKGKERTLWPI